MDTKQFINLLSEYQAACSLAGFNKALSEQIRDYRCECFRNRQAEFSRQASELFNELVKSFEEASTGYPLPSTSEGNAENEAKKAKRTKKAAKGNAANAGKELSDSERLYIRDMAVNSVAFRDYNKYGLAKEDQVHILNAAEEIRKEKGIAGLNLFLSYMGYHYPPAESGKAKIRRLKAGLEALSVDRYKGYQIDSQVQ